MDDVLLTKKNIYKETISQDFEIFCGKVDDTEDEVMGKSDTSVRMVPTNNAGLLQKLS